MSDVRREGGKKRRYQASVSAPPLRPVYLARYRGINPSRRGLDERGHDARQAEDAHAHPNPEPNFVPPCHVGGNDVLVDKMYRPIHLPQQAEVVDVRPMVSVVLLPIEHDPQLVLQGFHDRRPLDFGFVRHEMIILAEVSVQQLETHDRPQQAIVIVCLPRHAVRARHRHHVRAHEDVEIGAARQHPLDDDVPGYLVMPLELEASLEHDRLHDVIAFAEILGIVEYDVDHAAVQIALEIQHYRRQDECDIRGTA